MRWVAGREKICINKTVPFDNVAATYFDATRAAAACKHRPGADEGMELSPLTAGVNGGWQILEQRFVEHPSGEACIELARVNANKMRTKSRGDHLACELIRGKLPAGED